MSAAESFLEGEHRRGGAPPRHIDQATARLDMLARSWIDVQQTRLALAQREVDAPAFAVAEAQLSRDLSKALRKHPLWPWLKQFPGLGGAHTALIIGRIGDPRRYPGQRCSEGHYLPPQFAVGAPCPIVDAASESDGSPGGGAEKNTGLADSHAEIVERAGCPGVMLPPRPGTGTRSLWHWAGLHVVDGRSPRKRKGFQCDWEPRVRTSVLMDYGLAYQIVNHRCQPYRGIYDVTKARLLAERAWPADEASESELATGGLVVAESADEGLARVGSAGALRPIQAEHIARKVAAKAFLGDLLAEWKRLAA